MSITPVLTPKMSISSPWVERYRPSNFKDIVLDPLNREIFQNMLDTNYFPNLLFYGPPGTGKTTTIINLINEYQTIYNRKNMMSVIHLNASDERGIDIIRNQIHQFAKTMNLFESGLKFVILDEVDYMTKNAQQALKYILQTSNYNVRFCLICNYITKIDESLKNEFICVRFNKLPREDIFNFIQSICDKEELKIPKESIYRIQDTYMFDIRSMINYIQLNQNLLCMDANMCLDLPEIHQQITQKLDRLNICSFIHNTSMRYNIDKRTILQKYLNYLIRKSDNTLPSTDSIFLDRIEILLHCQNIPIDVGFTYLWDILHPPTVVKLI